MTRVFRKSDGSLVIIGASKAASRFRAGSAATSYEFGVNTAAGNAPVDIGTAGITISSGDPSGHFQVSDVGGRTMLSLSAAGDTANMSGSPYSLTLSTGSTITVTGIANAITVDSFTEMETVLESSSTPYGYRVYLREGGDYGTAVTLTIPTYTGTWTAPSNYAQYHQGVDLDTGNYVRVMAHTGESPTLTRDIIVQSANANAYVRFSGLTFNVTDIGRSTPTTYGMVDIQGVGWVAIDNCTLQAASSVDYGDTERRQGVYIRSRNSNSCPNLVVQDCVINDCWEGIKSTTGVNGITVVGNTIRRAWDDAIELDVGDNQRFCWNFIIDKLHPDSALGAHGDFLQLSGVLGSTADDLWIVGNVFARGAGRSGFSDGQGIFISDSGTPTYEKVRPVVVGNRTVVRFTRHISFGSTATPSTFDTVDGFVRNNSAIIDGGEATNTPLITLGDLTSGADINYNLLTRDDAASGTNIHVTRTTGKDDTFAGGQAALIDSAIGSTLAEVVANTNIIASSAPDTASPKVGAHQDYVDYINRTLSLPYSLPTPVA